MNGEELIKELEDTKHESLQKRVVRLEKMILCLIECEIKKKGKRAKK